MGLYKENKFKKIFENKKLWLGIGGVVLALLLIFLLTLVNWSAIFEKEKLKISFDDNPLVLSKKENTLINITLKNTTQEDLENLEIRINSVEDSFIIFCPDSQTNDKQRVVIPKVASGNERIVTCSVRYDVLKDFFEGTYSFDVDYNIKGEVYSKRVTLMVKR